MFDGRHARSSGLIRKNPSIAFILSVRRLKDPRFKLGEVEEIRRFYTSLRADCLQLGGLEESSGIRVRGPFGEMNDLVGRLLIAENLIGVFPGGFAHRRRRIKNLFPHRIIDHLMDDQDVRERV